MSDRLQTRLLAGALFMAGLVLVAVKVIVYDVPFAPEGGELAFAAVPDALMPFRGLEADTEETFRIMLMIPIGIVLLVFLRQFVGLPTIGTFMPVLIGISFRSTGPLIGVLLFTVLVALGLMVRLYFERLRLLLVPRLASILIVVVMAMIGVTLAFGHFDIDIGTSASLFPLVILAMTIERMAVAWEETDAMEAIKKGAGSLVVALLSYAVMVYRPLEDLMFRFPELLLVLLATTLMMGRYMGLRLSELVRFKEVA